MSWRSSVYASTAIALFGVLVVVAAIRGPELFTADGLRVAFAVAAPLVLATMAITPVALSGKGGVDLSIGPVMSFVNVTIIVWLIGNGVTSPVLVVPFALGLGVAIYAAQGTLVAVLRLQPVIVSLGAFLVFVGLTLTVLPQAGGSVPNWLDDLVSDVGGVPVPALVLLAAIAVWWAIDRSTFLRNVRLAGDSDRMAFACGVPIVPVRVGAYAIAGVFAGAAGLMFTALLGSGDPTQGSDYTLTAVTALILGGTSLAGGRGGMVGSIAGALDVYLITYILGTFDFGKNASFVVDLTYGLILVTSLVLGATLIRALGRRTA